MVVTANEIFSVTQRGCYKRPLSSISIEANIWELSNVGNCEDSDKPEYKL